MNTATIRDYIRVADDKKIRAIYTILEDNITEETEWWSDTILVAELEKDYEAWNAGKEKGYLLSEIKADIAKRKRKKKG